MSRMIERNKYSYSPVGSIAYFAMMVAGKVCEMIQRVCHLIRYEIHKMWELIRFPRKIKFSEEDLALLQEFEKSVIFVIDNRRCLPVPNRRKYLRKIRRVMDLVTDERLRPMDAWPRIRKILDRWDKAIKREYQDDPGVLI